MSISVQRNLRALLVAAGLALPCLGLPGLSLADEGAQYVPPEMDNHLAMELVAQEQPAVADAAEPPPMDTAPMDAVGAEDAAEPPVTPPDKAADPDETPPIDAPPVNKTPKGKAAKAPAEEELPPGETGAPYDERVHEGHYDGQYDESYGDGGFAELISSGSWFRCGRWFTQTELTLLHRSPAPDQELSQQPFIFGQNLFLHPAMTTQSANFGYEPGMKVTLGKYLGRDDENRDRSLEFTYFGLNNWTSQFAVTSQASIAAFLLETPLDRVAPAFSRATRQEYIYESDFNSFEVNAKIARRLGRDRMELKPDGRWVRECAPGLTPSFLAGFRTMLVNENFSFISQRRGFAAAAQPVADADGRFDITTNNRLFGIQLGAEVMEQRCNWSFGVRGKVGGYYNFAEQHSVVFTNDQAVAPAANLNQDRRASDEQLALAVELGLVGTYQFRPNLAFRAAYDFMWIQGLALGPEQLSFNFNPTPTVDTDSFHLYDGMSVGIEYVW